MNENIDGFLMRLGMMKRNHETKDSWTKIAQKINSEYKVDYDESTYRKKFANLVSVTDLKSDSALETDELGEKLREKVDDLNLARSKYNKIRSEYTRKISDKATSELVMDILREQIKKVQAQTPVQYNHKENKKSVIAMLSDVHYGISFDNAIGKYNPQIARQRLDAYANEIIALGQKNNADVCYLCLMGDMISGMIHNTLRIENVRNAIQQTMEISELICCFIQKISRYFAQVNVSSVNGNHSRIIPNKEDELNGEKLDAIVTWYCKSKLEDVKSVVFMDSGLDGTMAVVDAFDHLYMIVHGDYDRNAALTYAKMTNRYHGRIDYILAGHTHVAGFDFGDASVIRNGSVIGSGDEYTIKKRLFAPAYQVCMLVDEKGVNSIHPVRLEEVS